MQRMKTVTVKKNQTVYDLALEQYGTCEAVGELLRNNPALRNDPAALAARGIDSVNDPALYVDVALLPGMEAAVDPASPLAERPTVREINSDIMTYEE